MNAWILIGVILLFIGILCLVWYQWVFCGHKDRRLHDILSPDLPLRFSNQETQVEDSAKYVEMNS